MKLVRMVRDTPTKGGAKVLKVPESDVDKLKYQGWTVAGESAEKQPDNAQNGGNPPKKEEPKAEVSSETKAETSAEAKSDTSTEMKPDVKAETKSNKGGNKKPLRDE